MNRTKEATDQRVATVAIGRCLLGENRVKTTRETAKTTPDSAAPASAIRVPNPPIKAPQIQSMIAIAVAKHCAVANARNESEISGEFTARPHVLLVKIP